MQNTDNNREVEKGDECVGDGDDLVTMREAIERPEHVTESK